MSSSFLLYGANGYTGQLIATMAATYGLSPILAGRNDAELKKLSEKTGYPYRVAALNDATALDNIMQDVSLVLHAAGPFRFTAKPMMEACLRNGKHYLDITGEIGVYELAKKKFHEQAQAKGIMLMPGVGFDVVPTDCMALHLKNQMPDATSLKLAFVGIGGGVSRGTATTAALGLGEKGAARENGQIVQVPLGRHGMLVDFGLKKRFVMSIPWGDVSTAYSTTSIPNIETFMGVAPSTYKMLKFQFLFNWLLRLPFMKQRQINKIKSGPAGPSDEQRAKAYSLVWGEVKNAAGKKLEGRLKTPEGYTLTAMTSLIITRKVLNGDFKPGYQTPAGCYGEGVILEAEGSAFL